MQNQLNLLYREEEREMLPMCEREGVGVIPWSPLARGRLARANDEETVRSKTDGVGKALYENDDKNDRAVIDAVGKIAEARGVSRASVALAWHYTKPALAAPIIGASKEHHIDAAVTALDIDLSDDEIDALEAPYQPKAPTGMGMPLPPMNQVSVKPG